MPHTDPTATDEALMLRFRDTLDDAAFDVLMDRYYGRALTIAGSRIFDRSLAQDAVQETFIRMVRERKKYDGRKFSPWFYTILRNICTDFVRREMRHRDKMDALSVVIPDDAPSDKRNDFDELIAALPPTDRELLVYRYVQGLSFQEISELMDITEDTAKKRGQRALQKLRDTFVPPDGERA
ncbi:MAG: sigma-70 family RNA polymerase sigma factor [Kiritimatiellaceae bacterium]|nr:sigma-70 family RNA polymerase sigma factor [Kiritimatiellaceae bacterium]